MNWKRIEDRLQCKSSELTKIQTQIRAELYHLRKTYHDRSTTQNNVTNQQRRHYPERMFQQTLQERVTSTSRSPSFSPYKGKRHISPLHIPNRENMSPPERKHYPQRFKDNVPIAFKKNRNPSAYLIRRDPSEVHTRRQNSSILSFVQAKGPCNERPSKKFLPQNHKFIKQFF